MSINELLSLTQNRARSDLHLSSGNNRLEALPIPRLQPDFHTGSHPPRLARANRFGNPLSVTNH